MPENVFTADEVVALVTNRDLMTRLRPPPPEEDDEPLPGMEGVRPLHVALVEAFLAGEGLDYREEAALQDAALAAARAEMDQLHAQAAGLLEGAGYRRPTVGEILGIRRRLDEENPGD